MPTPRSYKIAASLKQSCNLLGVSPAAVLARCQLPSDYLENERKGVDESMFFAVWRALFEEYPNPSQFPIVLGQGFTCGQFQPALMAFSSSANIHAGLSRLAIFKPLVAPVRLRLERTKEAFWVRFVSSNGGPLPDILNTTEVVFFLELARTFTAHHIKPVQVMLPTVQYVSLAYEEYVSCPIIEGAQAGLAFSAQDADRPFVSADTEFCRLVERELLARLADDANNGPISSRVRRILTDLLASGSISSELVSQRLKISKRSLQRKLKEEGTSFQAVLDETRASLAMSYLQEQNLSVEETSYLLAYQDPNSFYRAFHGWTGMTPAQARGGLKEPASA